MRVCACLLVGAVFASCSSEIEAYCDKVAECYEKDCEYTDDACSALKDGRRRRCVADLEAEHNAIATGDDDACGECVEAREAYLGCAAALDSCAAFESAGGRDGDCADESDEEDDACDGVASACLE